MKSMVVGLGNPGKKYINSKHNVGFMAIDKFAEINKIKFKKSVKFNSEIAEYNNCVFVKPKTYMNNSGYAVFKLADYYNIPLDRILVIYDDVALPLAKLRLRFKGGAGGHNGIKSLLAHLNSENFNRLRIGIDKDSKKDMADYVLSDFSKAELKILDDVLILVTSIIEDFIDVLDFEKIMNKYNNINNKGED